MTSDSSSDFYSAFENKYRGSLAVVKERLSIYIPFVLPLFLERPELVWLDIGCGRGEWLKLLTQNGIGCQGVDTHDGFVLACKAQGLQVQQADAIAWLKAQPSQSLLGVSGFHIAEHLPFEALLSLFHEAQRVLVPGGLLILETPNPENLLVGASYFYLDPTHHRPLPRQLLTFMAEYAGFARVKHLGLQEEIGLQASAAHGAEAVSQQLQLIDVLAGVSPDQAIVAQTKSNMPMPPAFEAAWQQIHGVSLHEMAARYEAQLQAILQSKTWRLASMFRNVYAGLRSLFTRT